MFIAGMFTAPAIILPSFSKAIKLPKIEFPRTKFLVPSRGSIIHLYGEFVFSYSNSSHKKLCPGKYFFIIETIFLSDSLSAIVTGLLSAFFSDFTFLLKYFINIFQDSFAASIATSRSFIFPQTRFLTAAVSLPADGCPSAAFQQEDYFQIQ